MGKERQRYQRKGFGLILASIQAVAFFWGVPAFGNHYWSAVAKWQEEAGLSYAAFYILWSLVQHNVIFFCSNAIFYVYYHFEFPLIERYKIN